ncbi:MAG: FprA family A-type flavoprotein, partial [Dehalococcoidales bacterium]|nr:FprA family A-type flavoprotein [Dehalococcoidales bacterium]
DYIICNHAEPDHSGAISHVLAKYPAAVVVCTERCKTMLIDLFGISAEKFKTVNDKETISLGNKTLEFIHLPWVHWPETMVTYLKEDKILFSCDFFGSHLSTTDFYVTDEGQMLEAAKRYYAEIMMPFRTFIQKNLEKLQGYDIKIIAPSHGPMHDKPAVIINAYHAWVFDEPKNTVVIPYTSMHGSTKKMVDFLASALAQRGVKAEEFELSVTDIGKLAIALVDAGTIIIGTPTVLTQPHPIVMYATLLANALKPKAKFASVIGSYGWGGKTVETIAASIPNLKVEVLTPVYIKGQPKEADYQALVTLAETIARKHKEAGLK